MVRLVLRLAGFLLLAGAFVTLVVDGTRSVASSQFTWLRVGEAIDRVSPQATALVRARLEALDHRLWDPVGSLALAAPLMLVLLVTGALLVHLTEERKPTVGTLARR